MYLSLVFRTSNIHTQRLCAPVVTFLKLLPFRNQQQVSFILLTWKNWTELADRAEFQFEQHSFTSTLSPSVNGHLFAVSFFILSVFLTAVSMSKLLTSSDHVQSSVQNQIALLTSLHCV